MSELNTETGSKKISPVQTLFAALVIPLILAVCIIIYMYVLGNPANFEGNSNANHPLPGNYLGIVYKGGIIVPLLMTLVVNCSTVV